MLQLLAALGLLVLETEVADQRSAGNRLLMILTPLMGLEKRWGLV